jgi:hypothetical protein
MAPILNHSFLNISLNLDNDELYSKSIEYTLIPQHPFREPILTSPLQVDFFCYVRETYPFAYNAISDPLTAFYVCKTGNLPGWIACPHGR